MPWFMVDDKFHSHPKRHRVPTESLGLWVLAGSWAADQLTDGFIPESVARGFSTRFRSQARQLCSAGLWESAEVDGVKGWQFHDWNVLQPSRSEVLAKREAAAERMRRYRARNASRSDDVTRHVTHDVTSSDVNVHEPQPYPTQPNHVVSSSVLGRGSVTRETRPPRTCPEHAGMDDPPKCGKCADARRAHDAWQPPTFTPETRCGLHPEHRALSCPKCEIETRPAPEGWRERQETTQ